MKESCACIYGVDSALLGFVFYRVRKQSNQQKENYKDKHIDNSHTFHTYFYNKANDDKGHVKASWTIKEPVEKKKAHRASQQLFSSCLKGDLSHQTFKPKSIKQNRHSTHSIFDALTTEHSQLRVKLIEAQERQQKRIRALALRIEEELSQLTSAFKVERQVLQHRIKRQQDCFYIRSKTSKSL